MAALADPPVDQIIAKPHGIVQFAAFASELCLVYSPTYYQLGPHGQKTGRLNEDAARFSFRDGVLKVPESGTVTTDQGRKFDAATLLEWLREHRLNGDHSSGFWEIPKVAPPVTDEEFEAVTIASATMDLERLRAILKAEEKGWARPMLLKATRAALERLEAFQAEFAAQAAEREAEEAKAAKKPAAKRAPGATS